jgi:tetratricopeptide (TPR) repeat protein
MVLKSLTMQFVQILLGLLALFLAWVLIFKKPLIFQLNAFMREHVFTDQLVLFSGGRIAFLLLVLGVVALFSGVDLVTRNQVLGPRSASKIFERAQDDFNDKDYNAALVKCRELLHSNPSDVAVLELMMRAHRELGQKDEARETLRKILEINPRYSVKNASSKKK